MDYSDTLDLITNTPVHVYNFYVDKYVTNFELVCIRRVLSSLFLLIA